MAMNALALNVQTPNINAVEQFDAGQEAATVNKARNFQMEVEGLKHLGTIALGTMGGKLDGQADPAMWDEAMTMLGDAGKEYIGRPDMAPILARGSLDTMQQIQVAQNEKEFDLAMRKFEYDIARAAKADARAAAELPDAPKVETRYNSITGTEEKVQWNGKDWVPLGGAKAPSNSSGLQVTTNPDGTTSISMGGSGMPKLTEAQSKDAFYYIRGDGANEKLAANETSLTDLKDTVVGAVPLAGNYFTSEGFKAANRDGKEFLAAVLRKDSGGAITPDEWSYYGPMYLPAPGDGPTEIANKREARDRAMDALRAVSGPGQIVIEEYDRQKTGKAGAAPRVTPPDTVATKVIGGTTYTQDANGDWYEAE